jgi:hypothetical protein
MAMFLCDIIREIAEDNGAHQPALGGLVVTDWCESGASSIFVARY